MKTYLLIGLLALGACGKKASEHGRSELPALTKGVAKPTGEQFISSVETNDPSLAKNLLDRGANANVMLADGSTPLTYSIARNNSALIDVLLTAGADPGKMDKNGETPLHLALKNKNAPFVRSLIVHGADINAQDSKQRTPLMVAMILEIPTLPEWLIERGANVTIRDSRDRDALMLARELGRSDLVTILQVNILTARGDTDEEIVTGIYTRGDALALREFLIRRPDVLLLPLNPGHLIRAIGIRPQNSSIEAMEILLDYGLSVEGDHPETTTPLIEASKLGLLAQVKVLTSNRANLEAKDPEFKTALIHAIYQRHASVVDHLLKKRAKKTYEVVISTGKIKFDACTIARQLKNEAPDTTSYRASDSIVKKLGCWIF